MKNVCKKIMSIATFLIVFTSVVVKGSTKFSDNEMYDINTKRDILVLMMAYPEHIKDIEIDKDGFIYLVMRSGNKIIYDDKTKKNTSEKYSNPDLQDMLSDYYPLERINEVLDEDRDPGRIRVYSLLNEVYGSTQEKVSRNLVNANTKFGNIQFNQENSASKNLKNALKNIHETLEQNPKYWDYVSPINGTYNYRLIQGTGRLSSHAYGIAIDLNRNNNDYWKWVSRDAGSKRIKDYPNDIITAFENEGFIWGGKWSHFDILHFEYRPEFILKAKYFANTQWGKMVNWFDGVEINSKSEEIINLINEKLQ